MRRSLFLALLITICVSSSAHAQALSFSQAVLDWSGLSYTISDGLTVTLIQPANNLAASSADTTRGGLFDQNTMSQTAPNTWSTTGVDSHYTRDEGSAFATASTMNGLMVSTALAGTGPTEGLQPYGHGQAVTTVDFWLYGTGTGTITVTVPYRLDVSVTQTTPPPGTTFLTAATSNAYLFIGPGQTDGNGFRTDSLVLSNTAGTLNGLLSRTGTLTVSESLSNPTFGPLIGIGGGIETYATAQRVPEASSLWWLMGGLISVLGWHWVRTASSH